MAKNNKNNGKRYDHKHRLLRKGELERPDGYYMYRWTDRYGKRHTITAKTLEALRRREDEIYRDKLDGIRAEAQNITINDMYDLWCSLKRGVKDNTFQNYKYMYDMYVAPDFGRMRLQSLRKSDVKRFYNTLADERSLKISTIDNIHTVLHQVLDLAVEDNYIRINPSDNVLRELKQSHNMDTDHRRALTKSEQDLFLSFLRQENNPYHHWYPIFAVITGTGMRVGEVVGLRWRDIDLDAGTIDVNHTLVYYSHAKNGCYFNIHTPKTKAGNRIVPMLDEVKEAFLLEKQYQELSGIHCIARIDGYTDFIFVNRFGMTQHQGTLNKALRRIIRDCNDSILTKNPNARLLLPRFSCHSLRHTFATRMVENGVNLKVMQDVLGHTDVRTTMNIYADATEDFRTKEFRRLQQKLDDQQVP